MRYALPSCVTSGSAGALACLASNFNEPAFTRVGFCFVLVTANFLFLSVEEIS